MTFKHILAAAAMATLMGSSIGFAQTTPPAAPAAPAAATAAPMKAMKTKKPMTAESAACYADADKQNLHGRARKKFHHTCMKTAMKAKA